MSADAFDVALVVAHAFEDAAVPYAIGGALALGVWGVPRATLDVDVNVFVEDDALPLVLDALERSGARFERAHVLARCHADGWFSTTVSGIRVDVFTPSIPFAFEAARTRTSLVYEGRAVSFLSKEALAVFKMLFFRPKDLVDLERLLVLSLDLDRAYVRAKLVETVGDDDPRIARWDAFGPGV